LYGMGQGATHRQSRLKYSGRSFAQQKRLRMTVQRSFAQQKRVGMTVQRSFVRRGGLQEGVLEFRVSENQQLAIGNQLQQREPNSYRKTGPTAPPATAGGSPTSLRMRPTRKYCHPEALLLREGSPGMLRTQSPSAWLFGDEPSGCNLIRRALASSASFIDCPRTRNSLTQDSLRSCKGIFVWHGQGATQQQSRLKYSGRSFAQKKRFRMTSPSKATADPSTPVSIADPPQQPQRRRLPGTPG